MSFFRFLRYPLGLLASAAVVKAFGTTRQKERYNLLQRAHFAYGLYRAAEMAKFCGKKKATVCEFGVASGDGLLNLIALSEKVKKETDVHFRVVGFDTGQGLPDINGYKDHPEIWSVGDFLVVDKDSLMKRLDGRAEIFWGDIKDTADQFVKTLSNDEPLGFMSIDVDLYVASKNSLKCLTGNSDLYYPAVSVYLDDVGFIFANKWCGELVAIEEFNAENEFRKIDKDRSLPGSRPIPLAPWYEQMYVCHILDHNIRNHSCGRQGLDIEKHQNLMSSSFMY